MNEIAKTPMMQQWFACKEKAEEAVLLFQMGEFYEAFYEDAKILAEELDLTLTKRQEVPMAGIPLHACESYIDKLLSRGYRIAIAEQTEDPKNVKGLVKRDIVRVVTPGSVIQSSLISEKANNFIASVTQVGQLFGLSFADCSTGEFYVSEFFSSTDLFNELFRLHPREILIPKKWKEKHAASLETLKSELNPLFTYLEDWKFDHELAVQRLTSHLKVHHLEGFGLQGKVAAINAAGGLLLYLKDHLLLSLEGMQDIRIHETSLFMHLDNATEKNLELTESLHTRGPGHTLLKVLDQTSTAMGGRLLSRWIKQPLLCLNTIQKRQQSIQAFFREPSHAKKIEEIFSSIRDLERLITRIGTAYASPRDLKALAASFHAIPELKEHLQKIPSPLIHALADRLTPLPEMTTLIERALVDEPPLRLSDSPTFRAGYSEELDELRSLTQDSKTWLNCYQSDLREQLGIKSLKVGFTRAFGYYIEVSQGQIDKMPATFQRRQTLVNAERYISPELKAFETKVLSAEERIHGLEVSLFAHLKESVLHYTASILQTAAFIAELDCFASLAKVARERNYCLPHIHEGEELHIVNGRHPVVECVNGGKLFTPNDTLLNQTEQMLIITGPNMAGKSTYIRQVALIAIMAQIGSFVPASSASIGLVDKVFTRIGASDDLAKGQSTFMVEMTETANILNNATDRSLVILDEIGRGTSTYDGISIAWSVAEYLLTAEGKKARTLFATHYFELTKLEKLVPGAVNYNVAVQENADEILFLHRIVRGDTDRSYGIHVARLAGMPTWVLNRSKEILVHLEEGASEKNPFTPAKPKKGPPKKERPVYDRQLTLFS